jgi:hypothetical protein
VLYGNATTNYNATHATALANCDTTNDTFTAANLSLLKRIAMGASPKIRPFKTEDGYEYYVAFAGLNTFRDLKAIAEPSTRTLARVSRTAWTRTRCSRMATRSMTA